MFFEDFNELLVQTLRGRLRNGELTERGLARLVGVSQPHIHNVLKGTRSLSPELSDQILRLLRLSVLDLVDPFVLRQYLDGRENAAGPEIAHVPVLSGAVGPGQPWPAETERYARFRLPASVSSQLAHPVVVRAAADARMRPAVSEGDLLLLDQSLRARNEVESGCLYLLKTARGGLVRRLRVHQSAVFAVTEDAVDRPTAWEKLGTASTDLHQLVRARVIPLPSDQQWV